MIKHNELLKKGYRCERVICNKGLDEGLAEVALKIARGEYKDCRILSGDVALEESTYELVNPSHLVYSRNKKGLSICMPELRHISTGELMMINICNKI